MGQQSNRSRGITRAGTREYDNFFRLYAEVVSAGPDRRCRSLLAGLADEDQGLYFVPLGFIPGPAALLFLKDGCVQVWDATPDVKRSIEIPTALVAVEELPIEIKEGLDDWKTLVEALGHEPSPFTLGLARRLHAGEIPRYLAMAMPWFRYQAGDPEVAFGVVLVPAENGMEVSRVYNPENIADVPAKSEVMTRDDLIEGKGPVQKMLKTWALMESNYASRYDRYGRPRQPRH